MKKYWKMLVWMLALLALSGCSAQVIQQRQQITSALTGCPADSIKIENAGYSAATMFNWKATCQGRVYSCMATEHNKICTEIK